MTDKQSVKHTPTPWRIEGGSILGQGVPPSNWVLGLTTITKQDAAYIVRAVNVHEILLKALKEIIDVTNGKGETQDESLEIYELAKEAIAKAEGK